MTVVPRVGISKCLLGEPVRYDGGHKRDALLVERLGPSVAWVPVCPEVEIGMPVPRPPIHLLQHGDDVHVVEFESGRDHTKAMVELADARITAFRAEGLHGFVFKARSPSCGIGDAPLTNEQGYESGMRSGVFAERVRRKWPSLPVISEAMLMVPDQLERFVARIFARARLAAVEGDSLAGFHADHDTLITSRVGPADESALHEAVRNGQRDVFEAAFGRAMRRLPDRPDHARALRAVAGDAATDVVDAYAAGRIPLSEAVVAVRAALPSRTNDVYLHPHPLCLEAYAVL